jgi:hypothetical protein
LRSHAAQRGEAAEPSARALRTHPGRQSAARDRAVKVPWWAARRLCAPDRPPNFRVPFHPHARLL